MKARFPRVAFTGAARSGKDTAALPLIAAGYHRRCFGDVIKHQLDPLVRAELGFSAFTEDDAQKTRIRGVLEQWGEANYDRITAQFFDGLPELCVNTRLCRWAEAALWRANGGKVVFIRRPGVQPATEWERGVLGELLEWNAVDFTVDNDGTPEELAAKIRELCLGAGYG